MLFVGGGMALFFLVKVVPGSGKSGCKLDKSGQLKCYLKSQAEQGKANGELIKLFAKAVGVTQDMVSIVQGGQARQKRIKIDLDISYDALLHCLGIERQIDMFHS